MKDAGLASLCLGLALVACQTRTPPDLAEVAAVDGDCDGASRALVAEGAQANAGIDAHAAINTTVAVIGSTAIATFVCTPVLILDIASRGGDFVTGTCFAAFVGKAKQGTEASEARYRLVRTAQAMRRIAACYSERGGPGDLQAAYAQIAQIRGSGAYAVLSPAERTGVAQEEADLRRRLTSRAP
jgi:hypothetical protein